MRLVRKKVMISNRRSELELFMFKSVHVSIFSIFEPWYLIEIDLVYDPIGFIPLWLSVINQVEL